MFPLSLFLLLLTPLAFAAPNRWCLPINPTFNNVKHPDSDPNCKGGLLDRAQHGPVCHCQYFVKWRNSKGCPIQYYSKCSPILINGIAILRDQPLAVPPQSYVDGIRKPTPYGSTHIGYGPASRTRTEFPTKVGINCLEARDIILAAIIRGIGDYPVPSCTKDDKYEIQQCTSGVASECWCVVPETGEELSDSRGPYSSVNCNGGIDKKPPNPTVQYAEFGAITQKPVQPSLTTPQAHEEVTTTDRVIPEGTTAAKPEAPDDSTEPIPSDSDAPETPVETEETEQTTSQVDPLDASTTETPEDVETGETELTTGQVELEIPKATIAAKPEVPEEATEPIPSDSDAPETPVETGETEQTTSQVDPLDASTTEIPEDIETGEVKLTTGQVDPEVPETTIPDAGTTEIPEDIETGEAELTTGQVEPEIPEATIETKPEAPEEAPEPIPSDAGTTETPVEIGEAVQTTPQVDPSDAVTTEIPEDVETGEADQTTAQVELTIPEATVAAKPEGPEEATEPVPSDTGTTEIPEDVETVEVDQTTAQVAATIPEATIAAKPKAPEEAAEPIPSDAGTTETPVETGEADQTTPQVDPSDAVTTEIPEDVETGEADQTTAQVEPTIPEATVATKPEGPEEATEPIPSDAGTTEIPDDVETGEADQTTAQVAAAIPEATIAAKPEAPEEAPEPIPSDAGTTETPVETGEADPTTPQVDPSDAVTTEIPEDVETGEADQTTAQVELTIPEATVAAKPEGPEEATEPIPSDAGTTEIPKDVETGEADQTTAQVAAAIPEATIAAKPEAPEEAPEPIPSDAGTTETPVETGEADQTTPQVDPSDAVTTEIPEDVETGEADQTTAQVELTIPEATVAAKPEGPEEATEPIPSDAGTTEIPEDVETGEADQTTAQVAAAIPEATIAAKPKAPEEAAEPIPSDAGTTETPVETGEADQTTPQVDPSDAVTTEIPEDVETGEADQTTEQVEPTMPEATVATKPEGPEEATEPIPSDAGTTEIPKDVETGEADQTTAQVAAAIPEATIAAKPEAPEEATEPIPSDAGTTETPVETGEADQTTPQMDPSDAVTTETPEDVETGEADQTTAQVETAIPEATMSPKPDGPEEATEPIPSDAGTTETPDDVEIEESELTTAKVDEPSVPEQPTVTEPEKEVKEPAIPEITAPVGPAPLDPYGPVPVQPVVPLNPQYNGPPGPSPPESVLSDTRIFADLAQPVVHGQAIKGKLPLGTSCRAAQQMIHRALREHGDDDFMLHIVSPTCNSDGTYRERQCSRLSGTCYCVKPETGEKIDPKSPKGMSCLMGTLPPHPGMPCTLAKDFLIKVFAQQGDDGLFTDSLLPQCTTDGNYRRKQCRGGLLGECYCVDERTGKSNKNTDCFDAITVKTGVSCARARNTLRKQLKKHGDDGFIFNGTAPKCTTNGMYAAKQCDNMHGECWCVDTKTGKRLDATKPGGKDCLTGGEPWPLVPPGANCLKSREIVKTEFKKHGVDDFLFNSMAPACTDDGKFEAQQCVGFSGECKCVDPNTGMILDPMTPEGKICILFEMPPHPNTPCLQAKAAVKKNLSKYGLSFFYEAVAPACTSDGRYKVIQCQELSGNCRCVDSVTGAKLQGNECLRK